jgi:hypothetical protein
MLMLPMWHVHIHFIHFLRWQHGCSASVDACNACVSAFVVLTTNHQPTQVSQCMYAYLRVHGHSPLQHQRG